MYKRIVSVFLALLMLLSLCACRRKNPAAISDSFIGTPVATEAPQTTPSPTPDNCTPTHLPTLNWVESEDGSSMTAVLPGTDGADSQVQIGVTEGEAVENAPVGGTVSTPTTTASPAPSDPPVPTNAPDQPQAPITVWTGPATDTTLAEYEAMSGEEQTLFYYSFANADDFLAWYNTAKAASEAGKDYIEIGLDGTVSAGG